MLADAERKVLRIIANYSAGRRRMPSLLKLGRKTGKAGKGCRRLWRNWRRKDTFKANICVALGTKWGHTSLGISIIKP